MALRKGYSHREMKLNLGSVHNVASFFLIALLPNLFGIGTSAPTNNSGLLGKVFDLQEFIDSEINAGQKRIVIPPGTYRVKPQNRQHLVLRNLSDVEIVAENVEMICTETTRAITISNCQNVTLRGLTIDYDPLPFTQGRIVKMAEDKRWLEFEIIDGYPENLQMRISIYDPTTELLRRNTYYGWQPFESVEDRRYRVEKADNYRFDPQRDTEELGDILVTNSNTAPNGSSAHAIVLNNCADVVLSDITLYASNCFGFLENNCERTTYLRCVIDRRALDNEIVPRGLRRFRSLNADAFHSKHATVGPRIIDCKALFMDDDAVNICGDYHMVMKSEGSRLRVLAKHDMNIQTADPLEIMTYDGRKLPEARGVAIEEIGRISEEELAFLGQQQMDKKLKEGASRNIYEVIINRPVDLPRGSIIAAANRIGSGFKVSGCEFGYNRSRGILIKGSHGTVSNNKIFGTWEEAVKVSPEYWWLESGSSDNVTITENVIQDGKGMGIAVYAHAGSGGIAPPGAHNNIVITGNTITNMHGLHIWVTSTQGLLLNNNEFGGEIPDIRIEKCRDIQADPPALIVDVEVVPGR